MMKINTNTLSLNIDEDKLEHLKVYTTDKARNTLASLWGADMEDLQHYYAIFMRKDINELTNDESFITLSAIQHGYLKNPDENIDIDEIKSQINVDLDIINREFHWNKEESIYFESWWPKPYMDIQNKELTFGVSLMNYDKRVYNRTLNRLFLTRYGHFSLNYSLSESEIAKALPLEHYTKNLDIISSAIDIPQGYRYQDIDKENDMPSRSRLINLILSAEIF